MSLGSQGSRYKDFIPESDPRFGDFNHEMALVVCTLEMVSQDLIVAISKGCSMSVCSKLGIVFQDSMVLILVQHSFSGYSKLGRGFQVWWF